MHGTQRPDSERNLYGSPRPSACEIARGGKGRPICDPDRHLTIVQAGQSLDERSIFFNLDGHCATLKWWLCPLHSLSPLNNSKQSGQCQITDYTLCLPFNRRFNQ